MRFETRGVKLVSSEFFEVERCEARWELAGGGMGEFRTRYAIRRGESVGIVPVVSAGEGAGEGESVVLVRQFRYPVAKADFDGYLWEIPAGMLREGELPAETARRELREETGVDVEEMAPLVSFYLSPGALDEKFHLFLARLPSGTRPGPLGGNPEEHEDLAVRAFALGEALEMIRGGLIMDAKTIASILYYRFTRETDKNGRIR